MTTLELAEAIARAVLDDVHADEHYLHLPSRVDEAAQAVFRVLREHGAWFYRVTENPPPVGGIIKMEQMELWP